MLRPDTDQLADIFAIEQNLYRYARGVDRRDWAMVRSAYHPGAYDNHGNYQGDIAGFIASLEKRHATIVQSLHLISNVMIEFDGPDSALVESYFTAWQRLGPQAGAARAAYVKEPLQERDSVDNEVIGRYVDHVTRRDGHWRIQHRDVLFDVYRSRIVPAGGEPNPRLTFSRRDDDDLLHLRRRERGL
jgi:hypothetical protein